MSTAEQNVAGVLSLCRFSLLIVSLSLPIVRFLLSSIEFHYYCLIRSISMTLIVIALGREAGRHTIMLEHSKRALASGCQGV